MKLIALSGKRGAGKFAMVDDADYEILATFKWHLSDGGYARGLLYKKEVDGKVYLKHIRMHRLILLPPQGIEVDHQDMNPLNNQKYNLRLATDSQNKFNIPKRAHNTSGFKGVSRNGNNRWRTTIRFNNKQYHLGCFATLEEAARAYDTAAKSLFGDFARTNF